MTYYVIMENDCAEFVCKTKDEAKTKLIKVKNRWEKSHGFKSAEFYGVNLVITRKNDFTIYYRIYEVPGSD